jgi:membrane protease YdiL (CAAX protease family)
VSGPDFEFSPVEEVKNPTGSGWVSLTIVLLALIGLQLYGYFSREPKETKNYAQEQQEFRMAVQLGEVGKRYPQLKPFADTASARIDDVVATLVEGRKKDPKAAALYVSMRFEIGEAILPGDLKLLQASKDPAERAMATIYGSKSLTPEQARKTAPVLDKKTFSQLMAQVHALEKAGDKSARRRLIPDAQIFKPLVGTFAILCAGTLGIFLLIVYFAMRASGRWKPEGHPAGKLDAAGADHYAGRASLMLLSWIGISLLVGLALGKVLSQGVLGILSEVAVIGIALYMATRLKGADGRPIRLLGSKGRVLGDIGWGLAATVANIPLLLCCVVPVQWLSKWLPPPEHPITLQLQSEQNLLGVLTIVAIAAVMAPIFEETCFRATIAPAMERAFGGPLMGIVATSLVFAMIHPTGIPAWPALAMIGGMAAMLVYQRGSILSAIVFHAGHNFSLVVLMLLMY